MIIGTEIKNLLTRCNAVFPSFCVACRLAPCWTRNLTHSRLFCDAAKCIGSALLLSPIVTSQSRSTKHTKLFKANESLDKTQKYVEVNYNKKL